MGRVLIIIVLLLTAIFAGILITVYKRTEKMPEIASENLAIMQARALGSYALGYGIKNKPDTSLIPLAPSYYPPTFSPFDVLDGSIDYIKYSAFDSDKDTIRIVANVSYGTAHHQSEAAVTFSPSHVTNAVAASGNIVVKGHAEINGDIDENAEPDFEKTFGISKEAMKDSMATNLYVDPPNNVTPIDNITWVDTNLTISNSNWEGSGILIVNGDLRFEGGHFGGVIWVIGDLYVSGNPVVDGAIFVECETEVETTITGTPTINFDFSVVNESFDNLPPESSETFLKIISWRE